MPGTVLQSLLLPWLPGEKALVWALAVSADGNDPGGLARSRARGGHGEGEDLGIRRLSCPWGRGWCAREPTASLTLHTN